MDGRHGLLTLMTLVVLVGSVPDAAHGAAASSSLATAIAGVDTDIRKAKKRLFDERRRIGDERLAKTAHLTRLEHEVARLRERWHEHARIVDAGGGRLDRLHGEAQRLEGLVEGASDMLVEARRNAETHFSTIERAWFRNELNAIDSLLSRQDVTTGTETCCRAVCDLLLAHVRFRSSLRCTPGRAVDEAGMEHDGTFIHGGGAGALFAGTAGSAPCGLVRIERGSAGVHVWPFLDADERRAVRLLAGGKAATVPVDVSGGLALRSLRVEGTLADDIRAGGPVMLPLVALACVGAMVALWKCCSLWLVPIPSDGSIAPFARALGTDRREAEEIVTRTRGPLRRLFATALRHAEASHEILEEVLHEAILAETPRLERALSVLSVGAAVAPLLGLLGTVTGMIGTFRLISVFGTGDARLLSSGISEALLTTEAGLIVAIPMVLLHALLSRRVRTITDGLEYATTVLVDERRHNEIGTRRAS